MDIAQAADPELLEVFSRLTALEDPTLDPSAARTQTSELAVAFVGALASTSLRELGQEHSGGDALGGLAADAHAPHPCRSRGLACGLTTKPVA